MILKMERVKMFLNSDGFEKSIEDFSKKINDERKIKIHQFEKLVKLRDFSGFVEKVIAKYKSKEYCDRWYSVDKIFPDGLADITSTRPYNPEIGLYFHEKFYSIKLINFYIVK